MSLLVETAPGAADRTDTPSLRLALVTGNYTHVADGVALTLNRLVSRLLAEGARVKIVAPAVERPALAGVGEVTAVPSVPIPGRPEYRLALGLPARVREGLLAFRPHIVHIASPDILGHQAVGFGRRAGIPVVASHHSIIEAYAAYYGMGFLAGLWTANLRSLYRDCAEVYAPSREVIDDLVSRRIASRVRLWTRGVDLDLFDPKHRSEAFRACRGIGAEEVVVSFVGRLVAEKNVRTVVAVVRALESRGLRFRMMFVGEGPMRAELACALPGAVFTGHLSGVRLAEAYASSDIFLFPSATESFGNVTLEAMASGLPAVCADAPGSRTLVVHGETGFLCPPFDHVSLANRTEALIRSGSLRGKLGGEARRRSRLFTWEEAMDRLLGYYSEVRARSRRTAT